MTQIILIALLIIATTACGSAKTNNPAIPSGLNSGFALILDDQTWVAEISPDKSQLQIEKQSGGQCIKWQAPATALLASLKSPRSQDITYFQKFLFPELEITKNNNVTGFRPLTTGQPCLVTARNLYLKSQVKTTDVILQLSFKSASEPSHLPQTENSWEFPGEYAYANQMVISPLMNIRRKIIEGITLNNNEMTGYLEYAAEKDQYIRSETIVSNWTNLGREVLWEDINQQNRFILYTNLSLNLLNVRHRDDKSEILNKFNEKLQLNGFAPLQEEK